jgi:hypothetical protein
MKVEITKFKCDAVYFMGAVNLINQQKDEVFHRERPVYPDEDPEIAQQEFVEKAARMVQGNNVSEENMLLQKRKSTGYKWVITNIE